MLTLPLKNVRTIGLYGMGGIGKTTICKSLRSEYSAELNGKVWHAKLGKKVAESVAEKIEHKVFLSIDNVWNEDESQEQAECLFEMGFHPESLVIVTSRNREVLEWLGSRKSVVSKCQSWMKMLRQCCSIQ